MADSTVAFTGGGLHTNSVTGVDLGNDGAVGYPNGFVSSNFSYGRLTLDSASDSVLFTSGNGAASNALYVTWLDLSGFTNSFASVTDAMTNLLHSAAGVNVYYAHSQVTSLNGWLNDGKYQLNDANGGLGGFLMPAVPEPSTLMLVLMAGGLTLLRRRAKA